MTASHAPYHEVSTTPLKSFASVRSPDVRRCCCSAALTLACRFERLTPKSSRSAKDDLSPSAVVFPPMLFHPIKKGLTLPLYAFLNERVGKLHRLPSVAGVPIPHAGATAPLRGIGDQNESQTLKHIEHGLQMRMLWGTAAN
jgi:hypothetical protein